MKQKKYYYITLIVLSLGVGVAVALFELEEQWKRYGIPFLISVVVVSVLVNLLYNAHYSRKINDLLPLLENKQYTDYLAQMEPIRSGLKSNHLENFCVLNMAAAYDNMGEFQKALALLQTLPYKKLTKDIQPVYHLNLALCYFHNKHNNDGMEYYESNKNTILKLVSYPRYQPYVEVLKLYVMLTTGELTQVKEQLDFIKDNFDLKNIHENLDYFNEQLLESVK